MLLAATVVMLLLLFPPFYCFFLAPVALVPLCVCIVRRNLRWRNLLYYWATGAAFFLVGLIWLAQVDVLGYTALSLYVGLYFALFAVGMRQLVVEMRLPATVAVPLVWTGVEYIRSTFVQGGFPWFMLGNCLTPWPVLIQAADLFGVWGLSFFLAMINGLVVDVLRLPLWQGVPSRATGARARKGRFSPVIGRLLTAVGVVVILEMGYGVFRLSQHTTKPGPRVAVIQENIPQSVKMSGEHGDEIFFKHLKLTQMAAAANPKPDLIAWPETMLPGFGNVEFLQASDKKLLAMDHGAFWANRRDHSRFYMDTLGDLCDQVNVPLLIGASSFEPRTNYSDSPKQNRTELLAPHVAHPVDYYAKVHLVPFGEYLPFRTLPVLGKYMIHLSPVEGEDFSNVPGKGFKRFALPVSEYGANPEPDGASLPPGVLEKAQYTFGTPICYEDVMPYPSREMTAPQFANGRKADFLINVSNDGWFQAVELDQHLEACQLRAVENRVPIARSVNTGNSGFIDSNGRIVKLVVDSQGNSAGAVGTDSWVMAVDSRVTFYSVIGDLFPIICGIMSAVLVGWTLVRPRRGTSANAANA